ncbi:phosphate ABC transporter ATP-binding protein [uncultured Tateyamaria sp.]|uniref:phosphate ABC transporter ATP-binding protein n=1 Tax=uncultured Tateyamaria sp. TaxID=455651 RepID=UPI002639054D|nr:phosphate ABC transporter ATP-binding protein [uncultured Tateyamaria sp.]
MLVERTITEQMSEPATARPDPALQANGITVSLNGRKLLRDVSLSVQPNEIMAIIGPSGCGKTTFLTTLNRMIHHTLPAATVEGDIVLNGRRVFPSDENPADLRCRIAMIFQRPNPFPFSIRMNMEFALKAAGDRDKASYPDKIEKNLRAVNLWDALKDRLNDTATSLSGGEQQRLCIARALLSGPDVVLFDEPCSALDPISSTAVEELISELKTERSIVIVTHNLAQAARISDHCAFFFSEDGSGRLMELGPTDQIMNHPRQETTRAYVNGEVC